MADSIHKLDTERILSDNQQWSELERKWGEPVDLDSVDLRDHGHGTSIRSAPSTSTLNRTTFDSAKVLHKFRRGRDLSDSLESEYERTSTKEESFRQFYFVGRNLFSKKSVEQICQHIDDWFKDLGTVRATSSARDSPTPRQSASNVVRHSATISGLSFDDTTTTPGSTPGRSTSRVSRSLEHMRSYISGLFRVCEKAPHA